MAITFANKIGLTRRKLAERLNAKFPEYHFEPENLQSQNPYYASAHFDCCSWYAYGTKKGSSLNLQVHSWNKMSDFIKKGVGIGIVGDEIDLNGTELCPILKQPLENAVADVHFSSARLNDAVSK